MLQLKSKGPDLWDSIIPEEARALPEDLAYVDELLRDGLRGRSGRELILANGPHVSFNEAIIRALDGSGIDGDGFAWGSLGLLNRPRDPPPSVPAESTCA